MITTRVDINLAIDAPNLYRFGYSETDDVLTVVNWQIGNPTFYNVTNGVKYFFVENIYNNDLPVIRLSRTIACDCSLEIDTIIREITEPLNTDWEDVQTSEEAVTNPLSTDWEDVQTTECSLEIDTITREITDPLITNWEDVQTTEEAALPDPLITNWEDIQTTECSLEIDTLTRQILGGFDTGFNNGFNT
ncbi:MAG: hypothetical protein V4585_05320 [Bacteroidota bacterium]